jgi:hypothetical protein
MGRGLHPRCRLDRTGPDLRAVRGRRPYPARLHPRPGKRGTGHRLHRRLRGRAVRTCEHGHAHPRGSAGHPALLARPVGPHRCPRPPGRCRTAGRRRAAHDGRRADLRVDRRHGIAGVDDRRRRKGQARACQRAGPALARHLRARRRALPWAGQVVSRRAVAALAACGVLARRRSTGLAQCIAARRHQPRLRPRHPRSRVTGTGTDRAARAADDLPAARPRGHAALHPCRAEAARQRRPARSRPEGSAGAPAAGTPAAARPRRGDRLCAAARLGLRAQPLDERHLDLPPRPHVPAARRLRDGLPAAARFPALSRAGRAHRAARPIADAAAAAAARLRHLAAVPVRSRPGWWQGRPDCDGGIGRLRRQHDRNRRAAPPRTSPTTRSAPRCASKRAKVGCMCSCPRCPTSSTSSN